MALSATGCDLLSTETSLDEDAVRKYVKDQTGASMPQGVAVIEARAGSASMDPYLNAVFKASSAEVDEFVAQLGERRVREFRADCRDLAGPVTFSEVPGSERVFDRGPRASTSGYQGGLESDYGLAGAVESGKLERCRDVVTVFAWPKKPLVDMAIQVGDSGVRRVVLRVTDL
ncbi:hypothetical protein [Tsukamurella sp. TY48]|uniref:hypothetical protein n=1 Tax=Tsukamurella TaxID=2060 RepID=UPI001C7DF152|nr:hypothetical protein [Tsukamurella sp. TY48]